MTSSTTSDTTTTPAADDLEKAFGLIEQGNEQETKNGYWEAADSFSQARNILQRLLEEQQQQQQQQQKTAESDNNNNNSSSSNEENEKIAALYEQQSREYLHRGRDSLLLAMRRENDGDRNGMSIAQEQDLPVPHPSYESLSDECIERRLRIFGRLFAREQQQEYAAAVGRHGGGGGDNALPASAATGTGEQQSSLEERLMNLNENLPSGFKTSDERMRDINRGLNRLGLSLYSAADQPAPFSRISAAAGPPKSDAEQVEDIIQQAKDEVAMQQQLSTTTTAAAAAVTDAGVEVSLSSSPAAAEDLADGVADALLAQDDEQLEKTVNSNHNSNDSGSENDDDDDDDEEEELTPEQIRAIQDKVVDAQAKLAQLIALLELDDSNDAEIHFEQSHGKKLLKDSRVLLFQATKQWTTGENNGGTTTGGQPPPPPKKAD